MPTAVFWNQREHLTQLKRMVNFYSGNFSQKKLSCNIFKNCPFFSIQHYNHSIGFHEKQTEKKGGK